MRNGASVFVIFLTVSIGEAAMDEFSQAEIQEAKRLLDEVQRERSQGSRPASGNGYADETPLEPLRIIAKPFVVRPASKIPPRGKLFADHYCRQFLSATVGPPGIGKTSLQLIEAVGMAAGINLLTGERLKKPCALHG
jgi:hypothetical protein